METITKIAAQNLDGYLFMAYLLSRTAVHNKGNFSRYSLIQEGGKRWTLSVETSYTDPKRNRNQQRRQ